MSSYQLPKLEIGTLLGQGKYAKVYKSKWHGKEVAVKAYQRVALTPNKLEDIERESRVLSILKH